MDLIAATGNQDKLGEIRAILKDMPLKVLSLDGFRGVPEVRENGRTLEANAKKKALCISRSLKRFVIADDSGLEVEALGGRPGVYSARFSGKGATYKSNNEKLLKLLKGIRASKRTGRFRCVIAVADRGRLIGTAEGRCDGRIASKPRGRSGFGYDPVFIPDGYKKTFAEIGLRVKNKISHRNKALIKAKSIINRYISTPRP